MRQLPGHAKTAGYAYAEFGLRSSLLRVLPINR